MFAKIFPLPFKRCGLGSWMGNWHPMEDWNPMTLGFQGTTKVRGETSQVPQAKQRGRAPGVKEATPSDEPGLRLNTLNDWCDSRGLIWHENNYHQNPSRTLMEAYGSHLENHFCPRGNSITLERVVSGRSTPSLPGVAGSFLSRPQVELAWVHETVEHHWFLGSTIYM